MQPADPRSRPARGTGELLITGATGFVGRNVARELHRRKVRFRTLVRPQTDRTILEGTGAWMVDGDLCRKSSLGPALDGVRHVIHLGAAVRSPDPALNQAVNVEGTANLIDASIQAGVERIVALSSDSVLRTRMSPYAQSKKEAEEALLTWGATAENSAVVLRPPLILGPQSKHLETFVKLSKLPLLPVPKDMAMRCPVFVDDIVDAILRSLELSEEAIPNVAIDLPGRTQIDLGDLIVAVAKCQGRQAPRIRRVPAGFMRQLGRIGGTRLLEQLQGLQEHVVLNGQLAEQLLEWSPQPLEQLLQRSLATDITTEDSV
jgi:nucleoside-diphosphate-sugar epimerase